MKLPPEQMQSLVDLALATRPDELTCDEWLVHVGRYVELRVAGEPIPPELAAVEQHIAVCEECAEELAALERALGG